MSDSSSSSASARSISASVGTRWCHSARSSMNDTPRPLFVRAMTHVGRPGASGTRSSVSMSAGMSWPSTSTTAQPNARQRSASGSSRIVRSVKSPCCRPLRSTMTVRRSRPKCAAGHRGLPVAALLQLAVAGQHERSPRLRRPALPPRATPTAIGSPCPSGPVFASTPGTLLRSGCPFSLRERLHVGRQPLAGKEPGLGERGVQRRGRMALAEHEAIAQRVCGIRGVDGEDPEVQGRENVRGGQVAARMPHLGRVDHAQAGAGGCAGPARPPPSCINMHVLLFMPEPVHASGAMSDCQRGRLVIPMPGPVPQRVRLSRLADARDAVRPRTIVTTDPELDDSNSMVRFLLYSNEVTTEGLVYASSQYHWRGDGKGTPLLEAEPRVRARRSQPLPCTSWRWNPAVHHIDEAVDIYAKVYPNLKVHDPNYPTPEHLKSKIREGNVEFDGDTSKDTPGSDLIKRRAARRQGRPGLSAGLGRPEHDRARADDHQGPVRNHAAVDGRFRRRSRRRRSSSRSAIRTTRTRFYIKPEWPGIEFRQMATTIWGYGARGVVPAGVRAVPVGGVDPGERLLGRPVWRALPRLARRQADGARRCLRLLR